MAELEVNGLREVSRKLKQMPKNLRNKHVRRALRNAGKPIRDAARAMVPKDTGFIESNIEMRSGRPSKNADVRIRIGVLSDQKKGGLVPGREKKRRKRKQGSVSTGLTGFANAPTYYWRFLEFGTSKMGARPFLRPAFESQKYRALLIFRRRLKKAIANEAKK